MINIESILSSFDDKGTLLKWLKEVEGALKGSVLTSIEIVNIDEFKIKFNFLFQDGTNILTPVIDLPMHAKFDAYDLLNILEAGDPNIIVDINEAGDKVEIHLDQTFIEKVDNLEATKKNFQGLILKEGLESIVDKKSFYKYFFDKRNLPTQNYIIEGGTEQTPTNENVINALGGLPPHFKRPAHWFILVKFIGNTNNHYSNGFTLDLLLRGSVDTDFYKMYMHSFNGTNATYDTGFVSLKGSNSGGYTNIYTQTSDNTVINLTEEQINKFKNAKGISIILKYNDDYGRSKEYTVQNFVRRDNFLLSSFYTSVSAGKLDEVYLFLSYNLSSKTVTFGGIQHIINSNTDIQVIAMTPKSIKSIDII